jgi:hypothetical protein
MCVDYKSLNKACPKDAFPLPQIDQVVDLNTWCELLSFLDAYSSTTRYPHRGGQSTTMLITPFACFFYVKMPLGLKNTGGT